MPTDCESLVASAYEAQATLLDQRRSLRSWLEGGENEGDEPPRP